MSAARDPDQADFDLERFVDMFDEALTSPDPRVINALRSLMMIVTLTRPESSEPAIDRNRGPLRRVFEDINHLNNRLHRVEAEIQRRDREAVQAKEGYNYAYKHDYPYEKYGLKEQIQSKVAAAQAAHIDQDLLNTLKNKAQGKIQGLFK
jgi:hypothetical protein